VICGKSQYAPNPPNAGKLMILARHEVASQIVHRCLLRGRASFERCRLARAQLLAIASTESTQSLSASAPNDVPSSLRPSPARMHDEHRLPVMGVAMPAPGGTERAAGPFGNQVWQLRCDRR
jgi:hypothetical protein